MSLLRSILQQSTERRPYSRAYELPLYNHHHEPTTIPRSLTESVHSASPSTQVIEELHASTARLEKASNVPAELVELHRKEQYLQSQLQKLLDAQADGLLAGLNGASNGGQSANGDGSGGELADAASFRSGSSTPTASSVRHDGSVTSSALRTNAEGKKSHMGLGTARRKIYQTMRQLADVKLAEEDFLSATQAHDEQILGQIDEWERKQNGLRREMDRIESYGDGQNAETLQAEADKLGGEIQDLEIRLAQMRTQHRHMLNELSNIENTVQSKLSSYQSSLTAMDADIKSFLKTAPERVAGKGGKGSSPFLMLPPQRRTLHMAKEFWQERLNDVERARKDGEVEKDALDEGAGVWKDVVSLVTDFETLLKREVGRLSRESDKAKLEKRTEDLLERMDGTLMELEASFRQAEEQEWSLLICCIGAELEAFKQGRDILESLLKQPAISAAPPPALKPSTASNSHLIDAGESSSRPKSASPKARLSPFRASPSRKSRLSSPPVPNKKTQDDDYSDDDPDPELLISHQRDDDGED